MVDMGVGIVEEVDMMTEVMAVVAVAVDIIEVAIVMKHLVAVVGIMVVGVVVVVADMMTDKGIVVVGVGLVEDEVGIAEEDMVILVGDFVVVEDVVVDEAEAEEGLPFVEDKLLCFIFYFSIFFFLRKNNRNVSFVQKSANSRIFWAKDKFFPKKKNLFVFCLKL